MHRHYSTIQEIDKLNMKERIEHQLHLESQNEESQEASISRHQGENTSHSTTEGNLPNNQMSEVGEGSEQDAGIMDRADVLFKYILRSFRKHYCKSF